jgi:hypothetical protein
MSFFAASLNQASLSHFRGELPNDVHDEVCHSRTIQALQAQAYHRWAAAIETARMAWKSASSVTTAACRS